MSKNREQADSLKWLGPEEEEEGESIYPGTCSSGLWYKPGLQVEF
jgi:hypothetical protein